MADIYPRRTWPTLVEEEATQYLAPMSGAMLASVFDYYTHLALIRHLGRPQIDKVFEYDFDPITTSPVNSTQDLQVRLQAPPYAAHVFVAVQYQASPYAISAPDLAALGAPPVCRIVNTLLKHAGAVLIDSPGMRWDYGDGTLPPTVRVNGIDWQEGVVNPGVGGDVYPPRWAISGMEINDAPPATVTRPRPLNVGTAAPTLLRWRLVATNARVLRAVAWILPEKVVSP